jgi:biotin carboxyl carrier protein
VADVEQPRRAGTGPSSTLTADIAASVVRVDVSVGDRVVAGQRLLTLESMKMEIPVIAAVDGLVTAVGVARGETVLEGDLLVEIE